MKTETLVRIESTSITCEEQAQLLVKQLNLPQAGDALFVLQVTEEGLKLQSLCEKKTGAIYVDFVTGSLAHRLKYGGGKGQMIAKAVGIQAGILPSVLDATAGLGKDAFILASLGCQVTLIERQPIVASLLEDGMKRAMSDHHLSHILQRMTLLKGNAVELMTSQITEAPQVIYLDPMFPHREKTALVKKEMRLFRDLVGDDDDSELLFKTALDLATHRVVVKRPRKAPAIAIDISPSYTLEGKSSRYDIYVKQSLKHLMASES